jgi:hypothetical protein
MKKIVGALLLVIVCNQAKSQVLTREDSLAAGLIRSNATTVISGYGNVNNTTNFTTKKSTINLDRLILFVGHKFNNKISFFSELELENAKIASGNADGEFSVEQAFVKFNINDNNYITGGLFIPRIGIINENHLPNTFNSNNRPMVETLVIPSTWRELGVSFYGASNRIPGLNYTFALVNGLSSANFKNGSGIKEGRFEGSNASSAALAVTGSLLYYRGFFRTQFSAYYGGSNGITPREADSLQLNKGMFSSPIGLLDFNIQYHGPRFQFKALACLVNISDAAKINTAYANNTSKQMVGAYLEVGYDFYKTDEKTARIYTRFEYINLNHKLAENSIENTTLKQNYLTSGLCFIPVKGVMLKLDYTYRVTGDVNPALVVNPFPKGLPYYTQQHSMNLGLAYSF